MLFIPQASIIYSFSYHFVHKVFSLFFYDGIYDVLKELKFKLLLFFFLCLTEIIFDAFASCSSLVQNFIKTLRGYLPNRCILRCFIANLFYRMRSSKKPVYSQNLLATYHFPYLIYFTRKNICLTL